MRMTQHMPCCVYSSHNYVSTTSRCFKSETCTSQEEQTKFNRIILVKHSFLQKNNIHSPQIWPWKELVMVVFSAVLHWDPFGCNKIADKSKKC